MANVPSATDEKSKVPILAAAIGVLVFVLFIAIFSISMGVFSSSNVTHLPATQDGESDTAGETDTAHGVGDFHTSYYDDLYLFEDSPEESDSSSGLSAKDSVEHLAWYDEQKREINSDKRKIEIERAELEKLKYETMNLIEQRKNMEDANTVQMAKLFDTMKADETAAIMANMTDERVGLILMKMKKQNASKVLAAIPAERAAKITLQMIDFAEGY